MASTNSAAKRLSIALYDGSGADWNRFVESQCGVVRYTHSHLYGWRHVMQRAMGHDAPYVVATDDSTGAIEGVLPIVRVKSTLFGHFLVSLPFLNYGGPLGTPATIRTLVTYAKAMAQSDGVKVLELRNRYDIGELDGFTVSHRKITVLMDSSGGSETVWKRLPSKLRSQVRRPQKEGVTVRIGLDQARPFYRVFAHHMRDLGTPVMPWRFFQCVIDEFAESTLFAVAYYNEKPIACGAGFMWGSLRDREFEITWASALRQYNRLSPNMLVYWELMKHVSDHGVNTFNFGRCTPGGNTHKFKTQWGTRDQPLWWYEHLAAGAASLTADSGAAELGASLWKRVPLPVANLLGPRLVRLIPL